MTKKWTIARDDAPDIKFTGERIARVESDERSGRWLILAMYRTAGGKYIAQRIGRTQWQGEHDRHEAAVFERAADVTQFFEYGHLSKDLYERARAAGVDVDDSEHID